MHDALEIGMTSVANFDVYIAMRRVSRSCMELHSTSASTQGCINLSDEDVVLPTSHP
jgi:hypothetical protein